MTYKRFEWIKNGDFIEYAGDAYLIQLHKIDRGYIVLLFGFYDPSHIPVDFDDKGIKGLKEAKKRGLELLVKHLSEVLSNVHKSLTTV